MLVVSEAENTCAILEDISAGTYSGAAFQVLISDWGSYGPGSISIDTLDSGTIEAGDGEPDMLAYAYVLFDGEGASFPLDGEGGEMIVNYIELGNNFEGRVNLDTFDPSQGAEGNFNACYCEAMSSFDMPGEPLGGGPPPDDGPGPDEG